MYGGRGRTSDVRPAPTGRGGLHCWYLTVLLRHRRREVHRPGPGRCPADPGDSAGVAALYRVWDRLAGWVMAMQGQGQVGLRSCVRVWRPYWPRGQRRRRISPAAHRGGRAYGAGRGGLGLLAEALLAFEATGRRDRLAETYRLKGELRSGWTGLGPGVKTPGAGRRVIQLSCLGRKQCSISPGNATLQPGSGATLERGAPRTTWRKPTN